MRPWLRQRNSVRVVSARFGSPSKSCSQVLALLMGTQLGEIVQHRDAERQGPPDGDWASIPWRTVTPKVIPSSLYRATTTAWRCSG